MKVQCSSCGKEYTLEPDENPSDFQCICGGELTKGESMKVQCSSCGKEYTLEPDENPSDFQCICGGELTIILEDQYDPESPEKNWRAIRKYRTILMKIWKKKHHLQMITWRKIF
jgi:predicted RNA-binding Zn-ribbon protein involved in translation (DUF1610 family)